MTKTMAEKYFLQYFTIVPGPGHLNFPKYQIDPLCLIQKRQEKAQGDEGMKNEKRMRHCEAIVFHPSEAVIYRKTTKLSSVVESREESQPLFNIPRPARRSAAASAQNGGHMLNC
jgi:hypothetical protein